MSRQYILKDGAPVAADLMEWARWMESADNGRVVAQDEPEAGVVVSTVFLGLDHSFSGGPPVLWETMVFGGDHDQYQERYTSREEAVAGHARAVALAHLPQEDHHASR